MPKKKQIDPLPLEFPSLEQAKRWYNSEEYRDPKALRFKTARSKLILVEGA